MSPRHVVDVRSGELLGSDPPGPVRSIHKEADAQFLQRTAVDLGEPHLKQHLLAFAAAGHL